MATATAERNVTRTPAHEAIESMIDMYEVGLERAREDVRAARDPALRAGAQNAVEQFQLAIQNARTALTITDTEAQFGNLKHDFSFRIPPRVDGFVESAAPLQSRNRVIYTTNPLEIAWLRQMVKRGQCEEISVGTRAIVFQNDTSRPMWGDEKMYQDLLSRGLIYP